MRSSFCVVCGQYTSYVSLGEGTTTLFEKTHLYPKLGETKSSVHTRAAIVRVVSGDPVCLEHEIRDSVNPNRLIRYAKTEKLEPDRYLIDGVVKST